MKIGKRIAMLELAAHTGDDIDGAREELGELENQMNETARAIALSGLGTNHVGENLRETLAQLKKMGERAKLYTEEEQT